MVSLYRFSPNHFQMVVYVIKMNSLFSVSGGGGFLSFIIVCSFRETCQLMCSIVLAYLESSELSVSTPPLTADTYIPGEARRVLNEPHDIKVPRE